MSHNQGHSEQQVFPAEQRDHQIILFEFHLLLEDTHIINRVNTWVNAICKSFHFYQLLTKLDTLLLDSVYFFLQENSEKPKF